MSESLTTRVLRRPDVQRRTGLGRTAIYVLMAEGKFPAPIRLTAKAVGWLEAEVAAWVAARVAERDAPKEGAAHGDSRSQALNAAPAGADGRKTRAPALKRRAEAAS